MNLERIMVSDLISQTQVRFHLNEVPRVVKFTEKIERWLPTAGEQRGMGVTALCLELEKMKSSGDGWQHNSVDVLNAWTVHQ